MRAIDSDHVIAMLDEIQPFAGNKAANAAINLAKDVVRNAPTVSPDDVRPVGKWLPHPDERVIETEICSVCGIGTKKMYHCTDGMQIWVEEPSFQYCPYCGAKMKGE